MTDRGFGVARFRLGGNVRRLMYQPLIWPEMLGDEARRLSPALDAEDLERLADSLVDRVRGNAQFGGNFLGTQMLIDEAQTIELALR